jgi:hypothetical protein
MRIRNLYGYELYECSLLVDYRTRLIDYQPRLIDYRTMIRHRNCTDTIPRIFNLLQRIDLDTE